MSLVWRISLLTGALFAVGMIALALSPATISRELLLTEGGVLAAALLVLALANALLVRAELAPLDHLTAFVRRVGAVIGDGRRPAVEGRGQVRELTRAFGEMLDRLDQARMEGNVRALEAQEAERTRIGQELHDEVGQRLTAILLGLSALRRTLPDDEELTILQETTRSTLAEVRRIVDRLRPGSLEELGLTGALNALAHDLAGLTGVYVRRELAPDLRLAPEVELVVYRVAQEALTNIGRHAQARNVRLSLAPRGTVVHLEIADDGVGFAPEAEGTGIQGMRERAQLVGGGLAVTSGPDGTLVRLVVPAEEAG
nr:sensor histidine kinase [Propionibacterium sp.]